MFNWLKRLNDRVNAYKDKRFLAAHNVSSWEEYHRVYDPDVNIQFTDLETRYYGYGYTALIRAELKDYGFHGVDVDMDQYNQLNTWCKENCVGKFRVDSAVLKRDKKTILVSSTYVATISGAADYFIIAFKDANDHMLFSMVWT